MCCFLATYYLRIFAWSIASSSVKIGTALDLCKVPIPLTLSPVYTFPLTGFVAQPPIVSRESYFGVSLIYRLDNALLILLTLILLLLNLVLILLIMIYIFRRNNKNK